MSEVLEKTIQKCSFMRSLYTLKIEEDWNLTPLHSVSIMCVYACRFCIDWECKGKTQQKQIWIRCMKYIRHCLLWKRLFNNTFRDHTKAQTKLNGTLVAKSCWSWLNPTCTSLFNKQMKYWNLFMPKQMKFLCDYWLVFV